MPSSRPRAHRSPDYELLRRFGDRYDVIGVNMLQCLHDARRPRDDHLIRKAILPETEMHGTIAGRGVADARCHVVVLCPTLAHNLDTSTDPVAVTLRSLLSKVQPMVFVVTPIHPDFGIRA